MEDASTGTISGGTTVSAPRLDAYAAQVASRLGKALQALAATLTPEDVTQQQQQQRADGPTTASTDAAASTDAVAGGVLLQVWMPREARDGGGATVLCSQGLPFSIAGGATDLPEIYRCVSCRYRFCTDTSRPERMGAIGRVHFTGEVRVAVVDVVVVVIVARARARVCVGLERRTAQQQQH